MRAGATLPWVLGAAWGIAVAVPLGRRAVRVEVAARATSLASPQGSQRIRPAWWSRLPARWREHSDGVAFGARSPSGEVQAARTAYHDCLTRAYEALHSYVHTSEVLLTAAHKVAEMYADADQLSTARMQDVDAALAAATTEVQVADAARAAAEAAQSAEEAEHETQRESHRGGR